MLRSYHAVLHADIGSLIPWMLKHFQPGLLAMYCRHDDPAFSLMGKGVIIEKALFLQKVKWMGSRKILQKFKPGVPKRWLLLVAALVWTFAGSMLVGNRIRSGDKIIKP